MSKCGGWIMVDWQIAAQQDCWRLPVQLCRGITSRFPTHYQVGESIDNK